MPTLSEALRYFLLEERSPQTNRVYRILLDELITAIGPDRDLRLVRFEDLADHFTRRREVDGLKPNSIATAIAVTKAFFNWAVTHGYVEQSPARLIRRRPPRAESGVDRAIPSDELRRMVEYARLTSPRNHALILFLADTGCRRGGAASLRRTALRLDLGFALVQEKGNVTFKARFGEETAAALARWLDERPAVDHNFVWTGQAPRCAPLTAQGITEVVRQLARSTGASRVWGPHAIRHAVGHAYAEAGIAPTATQEKLGHSDVKITLANYYPHGESYADRVSRENPLIALRAAPPPQEPEPGGPKLVVVRRSS